MIGKIGRSPPQWRESPGESDVQVRVGRLRALYLGGVGTLAYGRIQPRPVRPRRGGGGRECEAGAFDSWGERNEV